MKYFLILITLIFLACSNSTSKTEIIEGNLYFSTFRFGNLYHLPDSVIQDIDQKIDTFNAKNKEDSSFVECLRILKQENLLFSPFIDLKLKDSSIVKIYLDEENYSQFKTFKLKDLHDQNKKVRIKAKVTNLTNSLYEFHKFISIERVDGITNQKPSLKFGHSDYK